MLYFSICCTWGMMKYLEAEYNMRQTVYSYFFDWSFV